MADLDNSQSQNVALLSTMLGNTSNELRDWMPTHKRSFQEAFGRLNKLEQSARDGAPSPRVGGFSRLKIPNPAGWKLEILKGREDGFHLWRESFDLQTGSIWHGMEKIL